MFRATAFIILLHLASATSVQAQESPIQVTLIPAGATSFTEGKETNEPSFTNYDLGAALTVNLNRYFGVEGEVVGSVGRSQRLEFGSAGLEATSPNLLQYSGNVVVSAPDFAIVPFVTGGIGGVTLYDREAVGIQRNKTFLSGNVGGGLKWNTGRWGLRADYRFLAVRSRDVAPSAPNERPRPDFFGKENRYGHRLYAGVMVNFG